MCFVAAFSTINLKVGEKLELVLSFVFYSRTQENRQPQLLFGNAIQYSRALLKFIQVLVILKKSLIAIPYSRSKRA